jgi:hypothetical protein
LKNFTILLLFLIAAITSCETQQPQLEQKSIPPTPFARPFSIPDSLDKYAGADSLLDFDTIRFYIGRLNSKDFALLEVNDTITILYQRDKNKWTITDTMFYPISPHVEAHDLNGDHVKDIKVVYYISGAGGNEEVYCLLYNSAKEKFVHNPNFDLPNILYDPNKKLIYSSWWASVVHEQNKVSFRMAGDRLTFKEGVTYIPNEDNYEKSGTVEFYREQGAQRIVIKKIEGSPEKMWRIFSRAIWDTRE